MAIFKHVAILLATLQLASSYSVSGNKANNSNVRVSSGRREALRNIAFAGVSAALVAAPTTAFALESCKPGANNCVEGKWSPPAGASKTSAIEDLRSAISAYPQAGQSGVDEGGWTVANDDLDASGSARVEYRSSGKGNFAKFFNGGKPFVDDLKIEIDENNMVSFKSASRVGDSDFGVNGKRVEYLKDLLKGKGWSI
mmetsp:Transcript_25932/g.38721  ORF Transcript_25932/g.38721 Transcript_25932/m.38721 type:complete len:198 (-) Transcript_25932:489-1082(-)|eukprot:CAMPEP_0116020524 /NCGR_PEP_ID=MMETSP0321-20121206/9846_1 /TAXON_ID=163516 /ORGANISM="Leptocylindrus danicus var. danicus, Strain B650" /LENGTH=197 /DNA_ID=CAMNT_0003491227 /DNA_START=20 /DNA_END=613 /DNA_ORIENTATION=-